MLRAVGKTRKHKQGWVRIVTHVRIAFTNNYVSRTTHGVVIAQYRFLSQPKRIRSANLWTSRFEPVWQPEAVQRLLQRLPLSHLCSNFVVSFAVPTLGTSGTESATAHTAHGAGSAHNMCFSISLGRRRGLLLNTWCIQWTGTRHGGDFDPRVFHKNNVMTACQPEVVEGKGSPINAYAGRDIP